MQSDVTPQITRLLKLGADNVIYRGASAEARQLGIDESASACEE